MKQILRFLRIPIWPESLKTDVVYDRQHDDTDGGNEGHLMVQFSCDGDAWISIDHKKYIRFRNYMGGGRSPNVYAALLILAKAIELDNEGKNR